MMSQYSEQAEGEEELIPKDPARIQK